MLDKFTHKFLRIPYTLHVRHNQRPRKARATVVFIHGIGNSGDAWAEVIDRMADDVHVITIDLLGFGGSKRPRWSMYDANIQAKSVALTLLRLRIKKPLIIVGHSLGSLVAIEVAKRYKSLVQDLILCSPPLYDIYAIERGSGSLDHTLHRTYHTALKYPDQLLKLTTFATKYKLVNRSFNVTEDNIDTFIAALHGAIINQSALMDIKDIKPNTYIIRGRFDPFIVHKNLRTLADANPHIHLSTINAGHEVRGKFVDKVLKTLDTVLS